MCINADIALGLTRHISTDININKNEVLATDIFPSLLPVLHVPVMI